MASLFGDDDNEEDQEEEEEEEDILDMGEDDDTPQQDALLMRFCPHDASMLYPQVWSPNSLIFFSRLLRF